MKFRLRLLALICFVGSCTGKSSTAEPAGPDNLAYKWGKIALEATANDTEKFKPRPTVTSRILGLICTSMYDAWSRYDTLADPVYLKAERRPENEWTLKNKETAISYAAYRTMMMYYFSDSVMLTAKMKEFGFDPADMSLDPATPTGIGNLAAKTITETRMQDGSNQLGDVPGTMGTPYCDYTGYRPINSADTLNDLKRWQPKYFADGKGGQFCPACLTPHWGKVKPLLLDSANEFRSVPPPAIGSPQLIADIRQVVDLQAHLTDEQRALVEFMRDGPKSVQQAGHWFIFAQDVSVRDKHTLDQDVQMYFVVEAAAMDAFIACWDTKMYYDYARPYSLVHDYYKDSIITGWAGPEKGTIKEKGKEWRPYSPDTFLCPPFPSYVSGHSTISGACSEVLRLFTGSDYFGQEVKRIPGQLTETNRLGKEVTLKFPSFTQTADMAGMSRVMGGYHIEADNREGLTLGRNVGNAVFKKYLHYMHREK